MITPPLLLLAVSLAQVGAISGEDFRNSGCSGSKGTGYIPFSVKLSCVNSSGVGCEASASLNLQEISGTSYRFQCFEPVGSPLPITDIRPNLGGAKFSTPTGTWSFADLALVAEQVAFDPVAQILQWKLRANWTSGVGQSNGMDTFDVVVYGTMVWTTGTRSRLILTPTNCAANASGCKYGAQVPIPQGFTYGGTALNGFSMSYPRTNGTGPFSLNPTKLAAGVFPTFSSASNSLNLQNLCEIQGSPEIHCETYHLTLAGIPGEVEPYAFTVVLGQALNDPPGSFGFIAPTGPLAVMQCGLRSFELSTSSFAPSVNGIQFGATPVDCNWTGGFYTGTAVYHWGLTSSTSGNHNIAFSLDGTRLLQ